MASLMSHTNPSCTLSLIGGGDSIVLVSHRFCRLKNLRPSRASPSHCCASDQPSRRVVLTAAAACTGASRSPLTKAVSTESSASVTRVPPTEIDSRGIERLSLCPEGWNTWQWRSHNINWLSAGTTGPVVLLIHGFGASVYHWRYLVPFLAKNHQVFAIDCLGFGWSDKALVDYEGYTVWSDQIAEFIQEIVFPAAGNGGKPILVGNSLGGYNSLATAAAYPELVKGVVLLNAAGRFDLEATNTDYIKPPVAAEGSTEVSLLQKIAAQVATSMKRVVISASFLSMKQPARVRQVLRQVYYDDTNIDEDLVSSILLPAQDPNAAEVFYRVITAAGTPVNHLLDSLNKMPVFLLWGSEDPWCVPARATQIKQYYRLADRVDIQSGHCPHDDTPDVVGRELVKWIGGLRE